MIINEKFLNKSIDIPTEVLDTIDSTNEEAKRRIRNGERNDFVLVAREQTAGKGRKGRSFYSPKDTGVYITFTHFTDDDIESVLKTTVATGVIVQRAIQKAFNIECGIKWVNDLYYNNKKVCGILCECILKDTYEKQQNAIIIGIGINLSTSVFPEDIINKAGSVLNNEASDISELILHIEKGISDFFADSNYNFIDDYRKHSIVLGKKVELSDASGVFAKGIVKDINENGALVLETNGEFKVIDSGEVSLIVWDDVS